MQLSCSGSSGLSISNSTTPCYPSAPFPFGRASSLPPLPTSPCTSIFPEEGAAADDGAFTVPGQESFVSEAALKVLPALSPEALAPLHVVLPINLPYGTIVVERSSPSSSSPAASLGLHAAAGRDSNNDALLSTNNAYPQHHFFFDKQFPSSNNLFSRLHGFCNQSPSWLALDLGYVACREHQVAPVVDAFNAFFTEAFRRLANTPPPFGHKQGPCNKDISNSAFNYRPPTAPHLSVLLNNRRGGELRAGVGALLAQRRDLAPGFTNSPSAPTSLREAFNYSPWRSTTPPAPFSTAFCCLGSGPSSCSFPGEGRRGGGDSGRRRSSEGGFEVTRAVLNALLSSDDEADGAASTAPSTPPPGLSLRKKKDATGSTDSGDTTVSTQTSSYNRSVTALPLSSLSSLGFGERELEGFGRVGGNLFNNRRGGSGSIPPIKLRCSGVRLREDHGSGWFLYETPVEACSAHDIWYFDQILSLIRSFHSQLKEMRLCQHATMKPFTDNRVAIVILKQEGTGVPASDLERMSKFTCEGIEVCEIRLVRHKLQNKYGHPMFEIDPRYPDPSANIFSRPIAFNSGSSSSTYNNTTTTIVPTNAISESSTGRMMRSARGGQRSPTTVVGDRRKQHGRVVFARGLLSKIVEMSSEEIAHLQQQAAAGAVSYEDSGTYNNNNNTSLMMW